MQTLELSDRPAADLYWLAYLLTGEREPSVNLVIEVLDFDDGGSVFFSDWMRAWSRRLVIARALASVREELAASARRTQAERFEKTSLPARGWTLDARTTKSQLERALLAIDVFPRCAVLLTAFEGLSLEDTAVLLDTGRELVRKGRMAGFRELTRNLALGQGWTSLAANSGLKLGEMLRA